MFLAIEWTSTNFHAWLLDQSGTIQGEHQCPRGVNSVTNKDFAGVVREELAHWLTKVDAIYISGMATSRTGWLESPFATLPARPQDLIKAAVEARPDGLPTVFFLPGLARTLPLPDVMRGEEMAIFGIEGSLPKAIILPGAHSKWVTTDGEAITDLTTYMSGEVFNLLRKDSLVSKLIPADYTPSPEGFDKGLAIARDKRALPGGVLQRIFSARSLVLFDQLPAAGIADYLQGLIIGCEIVEALSGKSQPSEIVVLGQSPIADAYRTALAAFGIASPTRAANAAYGFAKILKQ
ncbi:2-dehydro-3-deoxygalactonokinase [Devosia sp. MC521]|uniref:2-dehydro-3-deoxygalactonokinase n=1 Tax=Devosia sp. MC521 TaxID=2759954 RepID=UPI0015FB9FE8|nr:2-dehydro-3-deoxygalactonokinase [Devosia sp. MC521]MBJ6985827.1 2-dehydro-3-deoxygalactonokinase [Devosia sp. MC521]QMW61205.1 2-dehydro-3-deoxygalactonokinase [Devosia sp. MC521]